MIALFKSRQTIGLVVLFLYSAALQLPTLLFLPETQPLKFPLVFLEFEFSGLSLQFFAGLWLVLIFFQALWFNRILHNKKVLSGLGQLPAFVFVLLMAFCQSHFFWTPMWLSTFPLMGATAILFGLMNTEGGDGSILNIGLLLGLAVFLHPPVILIFFCFQWALFRFKNFEPRQLLIMVVGFLLPFLFLSTYWFWEELFLETWASFFGEMFSFNIQGYGQIVHHWPSLLAFGSLFFLSIILGQFSLGSMLMQHRKIHQFFYVLSAFSVLSILLSPQWSLGLLAVWVFPGAYFVSHMFNFGLKNWWFEVLHLCLISAILIPHFV